MDVIHRGIAYLAVVGVIAGLIWAALLAATRRPGERTFIRFEAVIVVVLVLGAISGLAMLLTGETPRDDLHFLYAALAIGLVPLARSFFSSASARSAGLIWVATFLVLGGVLYRLFATG
jgi:hypothetical protein